MANSKLVSTKYLLRLRSQEEWEGWHFRAKAHFRKSGDSAPTRHGPFFLADGTYGLQCHSSEDSPRRGLT